MILSLGIFWPALAAAIDPASVVHSVNYSFPASGDGSPNGWGRPELYFLGGWFTGASNVWWAHSFQEHPGTVAYCIEPGAARDDSTVNYTSRGADYWESFVSGTAGTHGSVLNPTIDGATIRTLIGRVMEYGYQGEVDPAWRSQNAADADKLADLIATQLLIWEVVVGERNAAFDHVDPAGTGTYREGARTFTHARSAVLAYIGGDHPLREEILSHYDRIVSEVRKNAVLPSFMSETADGAGTVELKWNGSASWAGGKYTVTLTDDNEVLDSFAFSGEGLTFSVSGNRLTIASDRPLDPDVTITAATTRKTGSFLTWSDGKVGFNVSSKQDVVTYGTSVTDSVSAYLKVKAPAAEITVTKTSDDGAVAGIPVILRYGGETVASAQTDADGKTVFTGLPVGAVFTVEETVPEGYTAEKASQTVTTAAGGSAVTFVNHRNRVSLDLVKRSDDGNVSGIPFEAEIYGEDGWSSLGTFVTDENGSFSIPDLAARTTIRLTETVPDWYRAEERTQEITVTEDARTVTFVNHPLADLTIVKTSDDGNAAGIPFRLTQLSPEEKDLGVFRTDENGQIAVTGLDAGVTVRIEETVPEGYVSDRAARDVTLARGVNEVSFENRRILGTLKIVKSTRLSGEETAAVEGAVYAVFDADGETVAEAVTDADGTAVFEDLPYGAYTYREIRAPEGFEPDPDEYAFRISEADEIIEHERENDRKKGSLSVYKTDGNGQALPGVVFLLETSADGGETWEPVRAAEHDFAEAGVCGSEGLTDGTLTTGEDGRAVFSGLAVSTPAQTLFYRLTEVKTKDGYSLLSGHVFEGELTETEGIDLGFTVVNHPVFEMPRTGGNGFRYFLAEGVTAAFTVCAVTILLCRKNRAGRKNSSRGNSPRRSEKTMGGIDI